MTERNTDRYGSSWRLSQPRQRKKTLSFDQVEQIIGDKLPDSATKYRPWWANQEGGSRAPQRRAAGFKFDQVNLQRRIVRFKRIAAVKGQPRALSLAELVTEMNERAQGRPFGGLPEWRKQHKSIRSLPATPFYSVMKKEDRRYVFHVGGLSELQFNLGFEEVGADTIFRHGVPPFPLQTTRQMFQHRPAHTQDHTLQRISAPVSGVLCGV